MSTLSIRLSDDLDERLSEESRLASQPKSLLVRTALEHAASIAGMMLTTEAMVAEKPKKEAPAPAAPGPDMGM